MKKTTLALVFSLLIGTTGSSQTPKTWKLIWSDEFNYNGLPDSSKWSYDIGGHGWGNNELQYYTEKRLENARVENGMLIIEARKEDFKDKKFSSARLVTKGKGDWKYGKLEVRAKIPQGVGTWPAIWMLASKIPFTWPDDGEIDIMEHVGWNPFYVHGSVHTKKYNHIIGTHKTDTVIIKNVFEEFHLYAVEWNQEMVQVSVDGIIYFTFRNNGAGYESWPFDNEMHLLLNIAVGGNWGGAKGVDEKIWPRKMMIDWVRVWK